MDDHPFRDHIQAFIRAFGLLDPERTPCGQPLSLTQAYAFQRLAWSTPTTQQALADHLRLDKSTTSRLVSQMVERGWVERTENAANRRETFLTLTVSGAQVARDLAAAVHAQYDSLWERLPAADRDQVLSVLRLLTRTLTEQE